MSDPSGSITRRQTLLLAIIVGATVANIYYVQPLLPTLARYFATTASGIGAIAMFTQLGTAVGMLVFVPLGDAHSRRSLAFWLLLGDAASLILFATAHSLAVVAVASLFIGLTTSAGHVLVPFAAHLAPPERKGSTVGTVLSGLLIGILLARTVSGYVAQWFGWRTVYFMGSGVTLLFAFVVLFELPYQRPDVKIGLFDLWGSALRLIREQPVVREATVVSALLFLAFSSFWTTLGFLLQSPTYSYDTAAVGTFGLVGAAGALAAPLIGKLADRFDIRRNLLTTVSLATLSFIVMAYWGTHLPGLIVGILLLDIGMQGTHVSNQTRIYSLLPEARSRLNMIYMFSYFLAGSAGSFLGAKAWQKFGWTGVCAVGVVATAAAMMVFFASNAATKKEFAVTA